MDKFVDCTAELGQRDNGTVVTEEIRDIELDWRVVAGDAVHDGWARWPCVNNNGATGFDLPEGTAELSVKPICADGAPAASETYMAPAAVERKVIRGDVISLGAIELVVSVSNCDLGKPGMSTQPCICYVPPPHAADLR